MLGKYIFSSNLPSCLGHFLYFIIVSKINQGSCLGCLGGDDAPVIQNNSIPFLGPPKDQYVIINLTEVHLEPTLNVQTEESELALLSSKENTGPAPESEFHSGILKVQNKWDQRT